MEDFSRMCPWFWLAGGTLVTALISLIRINTKRPAQLMTIATLLATVFSAWKQVAGETSFALAGMLEISGLSLGALILMCVAALFFVIGSSRYLTKEGLHFSDYYLLLLVMILGGSILVASRDFLSFFIALETMSLPAYALSGFRRNDPRSNEAAMKYFILGGAAGAIFLMGAAMVFGATGHTEFSAVYQWTQNANGQSMLFSAGHILMLVALLFKVAAAPFHLWKPDVYEGAPTVVTGLMATIITVAATIGLVRIVHVVDFQKVEWSTYAEWLKQFLRFSALASIILGSFIAITQTNLKRLLAYSSISHSGYLLLGVLVSVGHAHSTLSVLWVYLAGYVLITVGVFTLLAQSEALGDRGVELVDLTGLLKRKPLQVGLWAIFLFAMAGIPFTSGFIIKYSIFASAVSNSETMSVVVAALCVVVSAYAYLRPLALMVMREPAPGASEWNSSLASQATAIVLAALVLIMGTLPSVWTNALQAILFNP